MAQAFLFRSIPNLRSSSLKSITTRKSLYQPQKADFTTGLNLRDSKPKPNPSFGGASLKELGANRTVKIVVLVALSIVGTAETIFWTKVLMAKFGWGIEATEDGEGEVD